MKSVELTSEERPHLVWRLRLLGNAWERLKGLLGTAPEDAPPVLLAPCSSLHTLGMAYPLDVAFIGRDGRVLATRTGLSPGSLASCRDAFCAAERPASSDPWFENGERLRILAIDVDKRADGAPNERTKHECPTA